MALKEKLQTEKSQAKKRVTSAMLKSSPFSRAKQRSAVKLLKLSSRQALLIVRPMKKQKV